MIALLAPFRRILSWLAIGFAAVAGVWIAAKRDARKEAKIKTLENEAKANDRITKADTGSGLSDDARRGKLHDLAKRWGRD